MNGRDEDFDLCFDPWVQYLKEEINYDPSKVNESITEDDDNNASMPHLLEQAAADDNSDSDDDDSLVEESNVTVKA